MDKIILHQFPRPNWGIANESPFCLKVETYLRMLSLPYELVEVVDPKKGPKGKLPYLSFNGERLTDSGRIISYLEMKYDMPMIKRLTPKQQAEALLVQRTLEEHMYWAVVHSRFIDKEGSDVFCGHYMKKIRFPFNYLLRNRLQREVKKELWYQGLGRHEISEMYELCLDDIKAVKVLLADKPYYFGDTPEIVDACLYANLAAIAYQPWDNVLSDYVRSQPTLVRYCDNMTRQYFPEFSQDDN